MLTYAPKYFTQRAIILYVILLVLISLAFWRYALHWYWMLFGLVEVVGFFYFSNRLTREWQGWSDAHFARTLFTSALTIRLVYVLFSYWFYQFMLGSSFDFGAADALFYNEIGHYGASLLREGNFHLYSELQAYSGAGFSDLGYPIYLSVLNVLVGDSILMVRLLKAVWSALTVLLVYRLARRNFAETTARMAAVFCMLMPNLIFYCGIHLKETEMVFLEMLFVERADYLMRQGRLIIGQTILLVLVGMYLFMFRTVLAAVLFIAFFMALTLSSTRVVNWGRRILMAVLGLAFIGLMFSNRIEEEVRQVAEVDVVTQQQKNMQWRSTRGAKEGTNNRYIKYASAAVFAPMIFTLPFPTMVETPSQENQKMIHGGNYVKNITSFFTIVALFLLILPYNWRRNLLEGEWRRHILPVAVLGGYLVVLVFSSFAHSERFHLPSLPLAMMFAAYGIERFRPEWKRWYWLWLGIIFAANIAWAYFKLGGRSML